MIRCIFVVALLSSSPCFGGDKSVLGTATRQEVLRDSSGRTTGTITTDSAGTNTIRDASGRVVGTQSRR